MSPPIATPGRTSFQDTKPATSTLQTATAALTSIRADYDKVQDVVYHGFVQLDTSQGLAADNGTVLTLVTDQQVDTVQDFQDLIQRVGECLGEMRHGLASQYVDGKTVLLIPDVVPEGAEEGEAITLSYPFRFRDIIPTIF